jgi:hypothetical protein
MADDLNVDKTPGFKVGEKKTLDEYQKLGKSTFIIHCFDFFCENFKFVEHSSLLCSLQGLATSLTVFPSLSLLHARVQGSTDVDAMQTKTMRLSIAGRHHLVSARATQSLIPTIPVSALSSL